MTEKDRSLVPNSSRDVNAFLNKVAATPPGKRAGEPGRLVFALDATASREPTWDTASHLHAQMFNVTESLGGLAVQLCYYRGFMEFHRTPWLEDADRLRREMTSVRCLGGHTQIARVLEHALAETRSQKVQAVIFIGDAMEENADTLCHHAGQLGMLGVPVFIFQEGKNARVEGVFRQIAKLSGGAWAPFDLRSADELRDLISAVAVFAAGGRKALKDMSRPGHAARALLEQLGD